MKTPDRKTSSVQNVSRRLAGHLSPTYTWKSGSQKQLHQLRTRRASLRWMKKIQVLLESVFVLDPRGLDWDLGSCSVTLCSALSAPPQIKEVLSFLSKWSFWRSFNQEWTSNKQNYSAKILLPTAAYIAMVRLQMSAKWTFSPVYLQR